MSLSPVFRGISDDGFYQPWFQSAINNKKDQPATFCHSQVEISISGASKKYCNGYSNGCKAPQMKSAERILRLCAINKNVIIC